jgi:ankyrin repeat protein
MNRLIAAVLKNDRAMVEQLLRDKADPNSIDKDNRTPLMHAAIAGHPELCRVLIEGGADVNAQDKGGYTALHFAAQNSQVLCAEALCKSGASVDIQDSYGNTPLWRAVFSSQGRGEMIHLLLNCGADRSIKNKSGKSPLDLANTIGNYDVKQFLA